MVRLLLLLDVFEASLGCTHLHDDPHVEGTPDPDLSQEIIAGILSICFEVWIGVAIFASSFLCHR